jgi:hypothetical protein
MLSSEAVTITTAPPSAHQALTYSITTSS